MALVYSYIRFSSKKQMTGDSFRRQVEMGEEWIRRHGHVPASLTLHDLGVPAFRGQNRHKGALSRFLEEIKAGRVKPGSILLVENLDRLSRQGVDEAYDLFKSILKAGVLIAVLKPYEHVYDHESLNDFIGILIPLLYFHLAYIESKNKSDRLGRVWRHKREDALDGKPFDRRRPSWVDWDGQGFVLNEGAKAIKFIFEKTADGMGQRQILGELQRHYRPIGTSGRWNTSFIQKVLNDRAVLGERQPKRFNENGERVPVGKPIPHYYPAAIDEALWHRAHAAKNSRKKQKGPTGQFVNLFTGIAFNAHDGFAMHIQTTRGNGHVQRRLVSFGHLSKVAGSDPVGVPYRAFEEIVLRSLNEITVEDLEPRRQGNALKEKQQELRGVEERLKQLGAALDDPETEDSPTLIASVGRLEQRERVLKAEIERMEQESHTEGRLSDTLDRILKLVEAHIDPRHPSRGRLRALVADLIESIYLKPEKHYGRVYCLVQINYRNGLVRQVEFGPKWMRICAAPSKPEELALDLRRREECRRTTLFAELAKGLSQPAEEEIPDVIPDGMGQAAEIWLKVARQKMARGSFRVVPSKVRRFVEFAGRDLDVAAIDSRLWLAWKRHLKREIRAGRLADATARVTFSRSRELVRWLIANGKTADIPELNVSSRSALA